MRRRDVIASLLGAPIAASWLAACGGDGGGELARIEGGFVGPSIEDGHLLRDEGARRALLSREVEERAVGVAILGGGPSGLSAGWRLARRGFRDFEVFELEPEVGGTSAGGQAELTAYPWGAHYLPVPRPEHAALVELLDEMGAWTERSGVRAPREHLLVRAPDERVFYRGFWYRGLLPRTDVTAAERAELARWDALVARWAAYRDARGRRAFDLPASRGSDDADVLALDRISAAALCEQYGIRAPRVRWWLEYGTRDDYGLSLEDASAWALLFYHCARLDAAGGESADFLTWPEGNAAIVDHLARAIGAPRIRPRHLVLRAREHDGAVRIDLFDTERRLPVRIRARRAICALPRFVAARTVEGAAIAEVPYGAWMVANLHLAARPSERGFPPAWDNVLYDSPSLGYVCATHQRGRDHGPTVWTYYLPFTDRDPRAGRRRLFDAEWSHWRDAILADLSRAHPDLRRHVRRIDVCRWGHAMAQPRVGVRSAALRDAPAAHGRVHFAHSDRSGLALFEEAFDHGVRAADGALAAEAG